MVSHEASAKDEHILLLGASGISGLAFIQQHLEMADDDKKPYLTLYIRPSGRAKLATVLPAVKTSSDKPAFKIRVVQGALDDKDAIKTALSSDSSFPKVSVVISLLGAYVSLWHFLTRTTPTPIGDAIKNVVVPGMRELNITRIMVLSTPTAFPVPGESKHKSWGWYLNSWMPYIVVPQGNAEMKAIGEAVLDNSGEKLHAVEGLEATVFRVPFLTDDITKPDVVAFIFGDKNTTENKALSRAAMNMWLLREIQDRYWVNNAPMLCDCN